MPNKISRFWQELKRRNVVRVITVYAGAVFVIIELINNITEPLRLPDWTPTFVIVLLAIGFPVVIIFSWIYDVHPEGGMVKTEPPEQEVEKPVPASSGGWKIASYVSFVVIVGLIVLHVFPRSGKKEILDKSIAVLPFRNESSDEQNTYFINGTMEAILDNLCRIRDLRVPGRTSMEQYRDVAKSVPEIAGEMHVSYLLEGSGQKIGNRILLYVQLLDGKNDRHIWSKQYDRKIERMEDLIDIQSDIARQIATEIEAIITPDEEEILNRLPTSSMTAYDLYLKANEFRKVYNETHDLASYHTAVNLYNLSLEADSTLAMAYIGLAWTYQNRNFWPEYFAENFLDSCLVMADMALSIDDRLEDAYYLKGFYYEANGDLEEALLNYNRVIDANPNYYSAYMRRGSLLSSIQSDNVKGLEDYHKALTLVGNEDRVPLLRDLANTYAKLGFGEIAEDYIHEIYALDSNRFLYTVAYAWGEFYQEHYDEALARMKEARQLDTTYLFNLHFYIYASDPDYREAYEHARKVIARAEQTGVPNYYQSHRIGYIYYQLGLSEEAQKFFEQQISYTERSIRLSRFYSQGKAAQYDLAATLAFLGDKEEAYRRLDEFNTLWYFGLDMISFVEGDPLFASIKDEDRFKGILQDMKSKHRAEHERVRQWLEENDML
jgi:TolB-like protein